MRNIITALCIGGALTSSPALAGDLTTSQMMPETPVVEEGWTYSVTPYFWATGLSGETSQFNLPTIDIDADFNDIFDNLNFAAMVMGEARNGPYSIFADVIYADLGAGTSTPRGILADTVGVETSTFAGLIGVGYSVLESSEGRLDIVGGLRVWSVDTEISFNGGVLDGQTRSDGATWVDGLVGVRATYSLTPSLYLTGWGLVGGGGADIDWDVMAGVGYNFNETISATVGYRAIGVDYSNNGFDFDVVQQGPMIGLTVRF